MTLFSHTIRQGIKRSLPSRGFSTQPFSSAAALQYATSIPTQKPFSSTQSLDSKINLQDRLRMMNESVEGIQNDSLSVINWAAKEFNGRVAMSTSFGIQSAVLLHMATRVLPNIPVVWVDTGYLPKETYEYAEQLKEVLDLNLIVKTNEEWSPARMEAVYGKLWEHDDAKSHALYGKLRKVDPLQKGLDSIPSNPLALLSGLRASQTKARANMKTIGFQNNRFKVLPMLKMTDMDVEQYMDHFDLPHHPLAAKGYVTVGDWHSSRPLEAGENARDTRFGGKFQECGLHADESASEDSPEELVPASEIELNSYRVTGVNALQEVTAHEDTDIAVIMVKKILEDGSYCRKCNDVQKKMEVDNVVDLIGYTGFADMRDGESEGIKLAKFFDIATAPFFLVRTKEEELNNQEWKVVRSYLQLRKMLQTAQDKVSTTK